MSDGIGMSKHFSCLFTRITTVNTGDLPDGRFQVASAVHILAAVLASAMAPHVDGSGARDLLPLQAQHPSQAICGDGDFKSRPTSGEYSGFNAQLARMAGNAEALGKSSILDTRTINIAKSIVTDVIGRNMEPKGDRCTGSASQSQGSRHAGKEQAALKAGGSVAVQGVLNDRNAVFNQLMDEFEKAGISDEKIDAIMLTLMEGLP